MRGLISTVLMIAFAAAVIGIPVPARQPSGDEDFPCRDHQCGCVSAEMCRTACCCFGATPTKPHAENGSDALFAAKPDKEPPCSGQAPSSCCGGRKAADEAESTPPSKLANDAGAEGSDDHETQHASSGPSIGRLACQGVKLLLMGLGVNLQSSGAALTLDAPNAESGPSIPYSVSLFAQTQLESATPPPRA